MKHIEIFCDGSCLGNPGPGGWGSIIRTPKGGELETIEISGGKKLTTNNEMELTAAIEALRLITEPSKISLTTDSQYLVKGMKEWIGGWIRNGWRTASKQPVKNKGLWEELIKHSKPHQMNWVWIRGHNGHLENERCDALANMAAERFR